MRQSHARTAGAPDELAFRAAFREYKEFVSSGGSVPGGRQRKDTVHRGYLLPRSTPVQVRELAAHESRSTGQKVSQGSVIARLVAAKHEATFGRS